MNTHPRSRARVQHTTGTVRARLLGGGAPAGRAGGRVEKLWHAAGLGLTSRLEQLLASGSPPSPQDLTDAFYQACAGGHGGRHSSCSPAAPSSTGRCRGAAARLWMPRPASHPPGPPCQVVARPGRAAHLPLSCISESRGSHCVLTEVRETAPEVVFGQQRKRAGSD